VGKMQSDRRRGVGKIQDLDERTVRSQLALAYMVPYNMMGSRQKIRHGADRFPHELNIVEQSYADRDAVRIHGIPVEIPRGFSMPLFEHVLPIVGARATWMHPGLCWHRLRVLPPVSQTASTPRGTTCWLATVMGRLEREIRGFTQR
jgi:hypothetical protein